MSYLFNEFDILKEGYKLIVLFNIYDFIMTVLYASGSTLFFYYYTDNTISKSNDSNGHLIFNLNWTLLAIALVFPLTMTLTETFKRRELALSNITILKSNVISLFSAHCTWDWYSINGSAREAYSGRTSDKSKENALLQTIAPGHIDAVKQTLVSYIDAIYTVLISPKVIQSRHYHTESGRKIKESILRAQGKLDNCVIAFHNELGNHLEVLKKAGLPAGESSRVFAFAERIFSSFIQLRYLKDYRTPAGLRVFAKLFIMFTPIAFGPYYALVAKSTNLLYAIMLNIVTTCAMLGLYNLRSRLEDPFINYRRSLHSSGIQSVLLSGARDEYRDPEDTIDLHYELQDLKNDISIIQQNKSSDYYKSLLPADISHP
jgi:hypothetical protein